MQQAVTDLLQQLKRQSSSTLLMRFNCKPRVAAQLSKALLLFGHALQAVQLIHKDFEVIDFSTCFYSILHTQFEQVV